MTPALLTPALLLWAVLGWTAPTLAANPHHDRAQAAMGEGRWANAAAAFADAYAFDPSSSQYLYAQGQALRFAGQCRAAIAVYERFIAADPPAEAIGDAELNIAWCHAELAAAPSPAPAAPKLAPPMLFSDPSPAPADTVLPRPAPQPVVLDAWGAALSLGGIAIAGTGGGLIASARLARNRARAAPNEQQYLDTIDGAATRSQAGVILLSAGGAALLAGVARYVWVAVRTRRRSATDRTKAQLPRSLGFVVRW